MVTVMALFDEGKSNNFVDYSCLVCIDFTSVSRVCSDLSMFFVFKKYSSMTHSISLIFISNGSANSVEVLEIASCPSDAISGMISSR